MAALLRLLTQKLNPPSLPPAQSFHNQTILITGATSGLGLETAIHYINLGASTVYITGRTLARANDAKAVVERRTGKTEVVQALELDMSTFAGVTKFVDALGKELKGKEVKGIGKGVDVVLLNAGVHKITYEVSPDGWEETLQVNTFSTILLALLLLPLLRSHPPASGRPQHLGIVSSGLHVTPDITTDDFPKEGVLRYWSESEHFRPGQGSYALSKLFMMYGAEEIVKLTRGKDERYVCYSFAFLTR
jgi:NAD(P)-dependent dehydrogenase (short-subunit alcohol dehydrogenase family)